MMAKIINNYHIIHTFILNMIQHFFNVLTEFQNKIKMNATGDKIIY